MIVDQNKIYCEIMEVVKKTAMRDETRRALLEAYGNTILSQSITAGLSDEKAADIMDAEFEFIRQEVVKNYDYARQIIHSKDH